MVEWVLVDLGLVGVALVKVFLVVHLMVEVLQAQQRQQLDEILLEFEVAAVFL